MNSTTTTAAAKTQMLQLDSRTQFVSRPPKLETRQRQRELASASASADDPLGFPTVNFGADDGSS